MREIYHINPRLLVRNNAHPLEGEGVFIMTLSLDRVFIN